MRCTLASAEPTAGWTGAAAVESCDTANNRMRPGPYFDGFPDAEWVSAHSNREDRTPAAPASPMIDEPEW